MYKGSQIMDNDYFQRFLEERREQYKTFTPMYCSALREYIHFTMRGFNHLRFHIDNTPRNPQEVMYKIGLLPLVRPAIYQSKRVEYEKRLAPVGGSRKIVMKEIEYWAITEIVGKQNVKIKVVLRKIGNSKQIHFWSVMKLGENLKTPI